MRFADADSFESALTASVGTALTASVGTALMVW
jgi:hypothetical protein